MTEHNPLAGYFRQPAIYIGLPSGGKWYPENALELSANDEFPVYPMTAIDEITYRTPDALYNGRAFVDVVSSCIPNIKDAWNIPSCDVDTLLVAIRIATYGHEMEINSQCPECQSDEPRTLDLRQVMDSLQAPSYDEPITKGDLQIFIQPLTYQQLNKNNAIQFEEQKLIQLLPDTDMEENEKISKMTEATNKITSMTLAALANSIAAIVTPDGTVTEKEHILEFLKNTDRGMFDTIRSKIVDLKSLSEVQPLEIECSSCQHKYKQGFTLDMTNFFGAVS